MSGRRRRIQIRPAALAELDDLAEYMARDSLAAARRFLLATQTTFEELSQMPGLGHLWPTVRPELRGVRVCRVRKFSSHLVFYRETSAGIEVLHILHGARDVDALLDDR